MSWMDVMHHYVDYEEPEKTPQPRCPSCGRFLPFEPNDEDYRTEPNGHWDYESEKWITDGPDFVCPVAHLWACKCGTKWESSDIFR